jgi:hypothetical protein
MTLVARIGSIGTLLAALFVAPAALEAQAGPGDRRPPSRFDEARDSVPVNARSAWVFGVTTFTRGDYQPSGVEATLAFRTSGLPFKAVAVGLRLGSFIQNQAVLIGRTKGYFAAGVANVRRPLVTLATVGSGDNPTFIKLELILEGVASLAANSPMPQGNLSGILAPLLAISIGNNGVLDQGQSLVIGPAWFVGKTAEWHPQVSFRFQLPRRH